MNSSLVPCEYMFDDVACGVLVLDSGLKIGEDVAESHAAGLTSSMGMSFLEQRWAQGVVTWNRRTLSRVR